MPSFTDLHAQLAAFEQTHANQRNGGRFIYHDTSPASVPLNGRFVYIEHDLAAVGQ
jgi:hypothetical protein